MTVATIQFMSDVLWREVLYTALLPDITTAGPYPVVYQLHGGNQNHTSWLYSSTIREYAHDLPVIIVFPDGPQSRWANGGTPLSAYEDFLITELADHVKRTFPASEGKWAISGNSMGGFGAVRLGLKYPQRFCSVWSHSGGFPGRTPLPSHWFWSADPNDLDCYALAERVDPQAMPRLSFDCGVGDHLIEDNRRFHAFLLAQGVAHAYAEHAGGHTWEYWNAHFPAAFAQHLLAFQQL